jgi:hypothetical protein
MPADPWRLSDPTFNYQFARPWREHPPPPKRARPAPLREEADRYPSLQQVRGHHNKLTSTAPRRKRRAAPSFKLIRIARKLLDPRRAP